MPEQRMCPICRSAHPALVRAGFAVIRCPLAGVSIGDIEVSRSGDTALMRPSTFDRLVDEIAQHEAAQTI